MSELHDIPAVSQSVDPEIRRALTRLIEGYRSLAGFTRDPYARALTVRDAQAGGVTVSPGVTVPIGGGTAVEEEPDLTPPPTVTGLDIVAGFSYVTVTWDAPTYTEGRGHLQTNIYAVKRASGDPLPTFASAAKVYSAPGPLTIAALPSEMNTIWHVWAKWETIDNVESSSPAGGVNGVTDTTGQDVSQLLDVLTGQITASELNATLTSRIDLIDADASVAGSVNNRIAVVQTQVNELLETPAYDNGVTYSADDMVTYDGGLYRALGATTGNLPTNTTYWEKIGDYASLADAVAAHAVTLTDHEARIDTAEGNITAEASARDALAAQIRGAYTGTDVASLTTGLIYSERVARASAVSAEATSRQTLSTVLTGLADPTGATLASLTSGLVYDERTARSTAVGTLTTQINNVSARLNSGGDISTAIVNVQTTASTALTNANNATTTANGAQSTANSTASQLTTLQSSIAAAGGNLLPNSSFEVDPAPSADGIAAGWAAYNNTSGAEPHVMSLVTGRLGGLAQRIAWTGTNTSTKGVLTSTAISEGGVTGGVRNGWQPNKTYVVSWYAYGSAGAAGVGMSLQWNVGPASTVALSSPALSAGWQRWAFRITTDATVEPNGRLYISITNGAAATGHVTIDDVMVQEGDLLTGYVPGDQPALTALLQQEVTTRASQTGALFAQWALKLDVNGYVSGFGLASTANNAAPSSLFLVRSDAFAVASPTGPGITPATPFVVRTTPTTENGVSVPVGVYMDAAYIVNVSALYARFGTLVADSIAVAQINAANLTLGTGAVGGNLRSTTFTSGSGSTPGSGWRLTPAGALEASSATIYGTIYASAGVFAGSLSGATGTFAGALSAATGTFAGALSAATGTFAGSLSAATGTFAGSLSAATGTFAGTLSAAVGSFFSSTSGQRITINESASNEARFYGNRGDGTITQLASIGINTVGSDSVVINVGDTASGNSRMGILARSNSSRAIQGTSVSGEGLAGFSTSSFGVWGQSSSSNGVIGTSNSTAFAGAGVLGTNGSSGPGLYGISISGFGVRAMGNATRAPLYIEPRGDFPSSGEAGSVLIIGNDLYFATSSGWRVVQSFAF